MKLSKTLFISALTLVGIAANAGEISDRVEQTKVLKVGTEGTYSPFSFHNKAGKLTGYDIDVISEIAKRLGLKVEFKETQWDAMFAGLNSKRFDVIANQVGATDERKEKYDFSTPYNYSRAVIVTRKDNNNVKTFADLKGLKSAQSATSNYTKLARDNGANLVTIDNFGQTVELVNQGRVDTTVNDQLVVLDYLKHHPKANIKIAVKRDQKMGSNFTFLKNEKPLVEKFNKALAEIKADGTLLKISQKWFNDDITK